MYSAESHRGQYVDRKEWAVGRCRGAISMQERVRLEVRGRARAECTANMLAMLVTPEMSKFSGWLNATAA